MYKKFVVKVISASTGDIISISEPKSLSAAKKDFIDLKSTYWDHYVSLVPAYTKGKEDEVEEAANKWLSEHDEE